MSNEKKEILNRLPKGWQWQQLDKVVRINSGIALPAIFKQEFRKGEIEFFKVAQMNNHKRYMIGAEFLFNTKTAEANRIKIFPKGSVLIPKRGGAILTNKKRILLKDASYDSNIMGLKAISTQLSDAYLFAFLQSVDLAEFLDESTIPQINNKHIERIRIPLPPLPEQQRIVQKLDALFARIDKAVSLAEENLEHLRHLLPAALNEVFEENYDEVLLTNFCQFNPPKSEVKNYGGLEVSFVPMANLNEKQISFTPHQSKPLQEVYTGYTYFKENDVLLAKVTPCFENGKSGIAKNLSNGIGFGSSEYYVFRASEKVLPEWIYYNISSSDFLREGAKNMSGAVGLKRVTKDFVNSWKIKLPDLPTQQKIIAYLNGLSTTQQSLQGHYAAKLRQLKALKASLLDAAFRGELSKVAEVVEMGLSQVAEEGERYGK